MQGQTEVSHAGLERPPDVWGMDFLFRGTVVDLNRIRLRCSLRCGVATIAGLILFGASSAMADSGGSGGSPVNDWSGLYASVNVGAAFGSFKSATTTNAGGYFGDFGPPFFFVPSDVAALNRYGNHKITSNGFSGGAGLGYDWQDGGFVAGIAADFNYLHMNGSRFGSSAYANATQFLESAYGNADWLVTVRPRAGFAKDNHLVYITGGLALANPEINSIFTDGNGAVESAARNSLKAGYALGAGLEWRLSGKITMNGEFLHVGFGSENGHQTASNLVPPVIDPAQAFGHRFSFNANLVRLGLNYRFGDFDGQPDDDSLPSPTLPDWLDDWKAEVGLRLWANSGRIGAPDPLFNVASLPLPSKVLASRITFSGLGSISGETYARFDHSSGFFIKGYVGAGGIDGGHQNDEDFPADAVYSNTLSTATGALGYATIDAGYSFLNSPTANFGAFVGYNYYKEHVNTFGCVQIAQDYYCDVPQKAPGLIQDDTYHSLRLGVSSQFMLTDWLKFSADVAYIPATLFDGRDDHNFRQLLLPESASSGDGVMLDANIDYFVTDAWSVGIGGRYWTFNTNDGSVAFNFLGTPPPSFIEPSLFNSERYGFFLQSEYRFGAVEQQKADDSASPVNWTGIYLGGTMGAGSGDGKWKDPYPSTTFFGFTNQAGFGDSDHATGPLLGGRLDANWQIDNFVVGLEADANWADIRGQNTCFSGLGGVGCGRAVNAVYDVAARGGYAWDRTLAFIKIGGALVDTKNSIFGNTYSYFVGTGPVTGNGQSHETPGGLLIGAGFEFAIDDDWTTTFEYNHIGGLNSKPSFPSVTVIGATPQSVSQSLNFINVGLSYKLY
jgi:hypothetical protein